MARVRRDDAIPRQDGVDGFAQGSRIDKIGTGCVLVGRVVVVPPVDAFARLLAAPTHTRVDCSLIKLGQNGLCCHPGIGKDRMLDRRLVSEFGRLDVHLRHHGAGRDQLAPLRGPMIQARTERDYEVTFAN